MLPLVFSRGWGLGLMSLPLVLHLSKILNYFFYLLFPATEHIGIGPTQVNNFLTAINLPFVSKSLLQKGYEETTPAIQRVAQRSIDRALQEESELTLGDLSLEGMVLLLVFVITCRH